MIDLTLKQTFGKNATQTANSITIQKADLPGLTASTENRAEQLLAALLLQVHQHFEGVLMDELGRTITDEQDRPITYNNCLLYEKTNLTYWKRQFMSVRGISFVLDTFLHDTFTLQTPIIDIPVDLNTLEY